jgi:hypothetical protein
MPLLAADCPWPNLGRADYLQMTEVEQLIFLAGRAGFKQVPVSHWLLRFDAGERLGEQGFRGEKRFITSGTMAGLILLDVLIRWD